MIIAFIAFVLFFVLMSVGLFFKGEPLKGSCGGVAKLMGNDECEICGGDPVKCDEENDKQAEDRKQRRQQKREQKDAGKGKAQASKDLAYDATNTTKGK